MQVTFTCEKCGFVQGIVTTIPGRSRDETIREFMDDGLGECPNCTKLTYGPLTEEMVADALIECSHSHDEVEDDYYEVEARFVLRLLNDMYPRGGMTRVPLPSADNTEDWRDWLLGLARQK